MPTSPGVLPGARAAVRARDRSETAFVAETPSPDHSRPDGSSVPPPAVRRRASMTRRLGLLAAVLAVALGGVLLQHRLQVADAPGSIANGTTTLPATAVAPSAAVAPAPIGWVDVPSSDTVVGPVVKLAGWALDADRIRAVEVRVGGRTQPATYGVARHDVAAVKPGYPDNPGSGFEVEVDVRALAGTAAGDRVRLDVVAINRQGVETLLARKSVVPPPPESVWRALDPGTLGTAERFYVLPGVSGIALDGAKELDTVYRAYASPTFAVGIRVPILYLRTTLGAAHDWRFDPNWDIERRCGSRRIAEDSLATLLDYVKAHRLPLLVTLNGGVWSDASCGVPEWDVTDHLETDPANCQWNQANEVMADDALKHLPGSQESPELGRVLTFNVYARDNRHYKRRNLQAAGKLIATFAKANPELFVGINLDPDNVLNPFYEEKQWYDYNPGTLKQFRHWLAGTGPYAGDGGRDVPDLRRFRRATPLTLAEVNRLAGKAWQRWQDVDPPREFPRTGRPFWDDPWTHEWERFRRHLVALHYEELAQWLVEAGIPAGRIHTSQGFMGPAADAMPFALYLDSPSKNYDTGGISVEGAVPRHGHLGVTVYGPAAENDIRMETPDSLFAAFSRQDRDWAIVEINTTDLRAPGVLPDYARAYRVFRDAFNFGARFVSPMAWNGSNGIFAGQPGYVAYTAWRNTPFEEAMRDFAVSHAYLPRGARLWTFGTPQLATDDGWTVQAPATLVADRARIEVRGDGPRALASPPRLALPRGRVDRLVLGIDPASLAGVEVAGRGAAGDWVPLARHDGQRAAPAGPAGIVLPLAWPASLPTIEQLRITLEPRDATRPLTLRHIALYPPAPQAAASAPAGR